LQHGIKRSPTPRIALEFLERFAIAKDYDDAEIERLLQAGSIYRQGASNPYIVHTTNTAHRAQAAQKNILIVNISGTLQPKEHDVGDLTRTRSGRLGLVRRNGAKEHGRKQREVHSVQE
jgi:hypothetical protein